MEGMNTLSGMMLSLIHILFDISDTHMVRGGRTPYLWKLQEQQKDRLLDHLADTYGLAEENAIDLQAALMAVRCV